MSRGLKYFVVTISLIVGVFILAVGACFFIDAFEIKHIEISGNLRYTDEQYIEKTSSAIDKNGFRLLFGDINSLDTFVYSLALRDRKIEKKLKSEDAYIKDINIKFVPPNKLEILVIEREEKYMIRFLERTIAISTDLIVLGETSEDQLIEIIGLPVGSYEIGEEVGFDEDIKNVLKEIYETSVYEGKSIFNKIKKIDLGDTPVLVLDNGVNVKFGDATDIGYKMRSMNEIYYDYLYDYSGGTLDLSDKDKKIYSP